MFVRRLFSGLLTMLKTPTAAARWKTYSVSAKANDNSSWLSIEPVTSVIWSITEDKLSSTPVERSSITVTEWPSETKRETKWEPTNPDPPVTKILMTELYLKESIQFELVGKLRHFPRIFGQ
jgi:hypothetical protein